MKKIPSLILIIFSIFVNSQNFKKIEILNEEKVKLAKDFIQSYANKCASENYEEFSNFKLSDHFKKFIKNELKVACISDDLLYGKTELLNLNSVYQNNESLFDNTELYIFDVKTEKDNDVKFLNVWVSRNHRIDGMMLTSTKPLKKKLTSCLHQCVGKKTKN